MVKGEGAPGFLYTIGLWESYKHPEVLIFAPSEDPTGMAQRLAAIAKRVGEGETFQSGKIFENFFGAHSGAIRDVLPIWLPSFMGVAYAFYENLSFPTVQLYWPDKQGIFPWQSGFNGDLFAYQPILNERNVVLANVGIEIALEATTDENPRAFEASIEELLLEPESIAKGDILENWRWRLGPEPQLFRITLFGDLFLRTANGHMHWLDTGSNIYEEIATDQDEWHRIICANPAVFFHASTLLHFRSLDFLPGEGQVYSWIQPPILGGQDTADNFDIVSAAVHILHSGRTAKNKQDASQSARVIDDDTMYTVVINSEEQYSMWPAEKEIPTGWRDAGMTGTKQECLELIEKVWTDMRPKSLRQKMEKDSQENQQ
jgi:MbtH protein